MWATLGLWACSVLARLLIKNQTSADAVLYGEGVGLPTRLEVLRGGMTSVEVTVPWGIRWRPGQHVFLRFLGVSVLGNHPFTVMSLPVDETSVCFPEEREPVEHTRENKMRFLVRSRAGFTRQLHGQVSESNGGVLRACLDGPYGGIPGRLENLYDAVVLVAGGGGITAVMPWLQHLVNGAVVGTTRVRKIKFLWIVRQKEHLDWVEGSLDRLTALAPRGTLETTFHITREHGSATAPDAVEKATSRAEVTQKGDAASWMDSCTQHGRPQLHKLLPDLIDREGNWAVIGMQETTFSDSLDKADQN